VTGSCPNNGQGFFFAGLGSLTRKWGLGSDNIIEVKILLASGETIVANKETHRDLFWAIQGSGMGQFGIILKMKLKCHSIDKVYDFKITYSLHELKHLLPVWFELINHTSIDLTSELIVTNNEVAGVNISGLYLKEDLKTLHELLQPILVIGEPIVIIHQVPYIEVVKESANTGRWLNFFKFKNAFVKHSLPAEVAEIIIKHIKLSRPDDYLSILNLGGLNNTISKHATSYVHRNLSAWFHINAQWSNEDDTPERLKWITDFFDAMDPYLTFEVYQNAPDLDLTDYLERYYGENLPKLIEIKTQYDPDNVFKYQQSIPPKHTYHDIEEIKV
jgi:hypothetical protein